MKVVKIADFYKELKNYPVEWDMVPKSWIREIFNDFIENHPEVWDKEKERVSNSTTCNSSF